LSRPRVVGGFGCRDLGISTGSTTGGPGHVDLDELDLRTFSSTEDWENGSGSPAKTPY
jgi:hypothetical protein